MNSTMRRLLVACSLLLLVNVVEPKCSPPEAIERKLEAKMDEAAKQGKEYQPPEDPVTTFMKTYPKLIRDSLPVSLENLKHLKRHDKLNNLGEDAAQAVKDLSLTTFIIGNVTRLIDDHNKFVSSSLLKFHRLETVPAKFYRSLRQNAKKTYKAIDDLLEEVVKDEQFEEREKLMTELRAAKADVEMYKTAIQYLDEENTSKFLTALLEEIRTSIDMEEVMERLPHKSDLYKNFEGGQMTVLFAQLSAAPVDELKRFLEKLLPKMKTFVENVYIKVDGHPTMTTLNRFTGTLSTMILNQEHLNFLKTSLKALVMAIRAGSEFPTDDDLVRALTDKLFLGEQAVAMEIGSGVIGRLEEFLEKQIIDASQDMENLKEVLSEMKQKFEGWLEFKTVADAAKQQRIELEEMDDEDEQENENMEIGTRGSEFTGTKDEL